MYKINPLPSLRCVTRAVRQPRWMSRVVRSASTIAEVSPFARTCGLQPHDSLTLLAQELRQLVQEGMVGPHRRPARAVSHPQAWARSRPLTPRPSRPTARQRRTTRRRRQHAFLHPVAHHVEREHRGEPSHDHATHTMHQSVRFISTRAVMRNHSVPRSLMLFVLLLGSGLLTSALPTHASAHQIHAPQPARSHLVKVQAPRLAIETDMVGFDRSASFNPSSALTEAKHTIAAQIRLLPRSGSREYVIFVWSISNSSFNSDELRLVVHIPAVPKKPVPPTDTNDINQDQTLQQVLAYHQAYAVYAATLSTATHKARAYAQEIEHLTLRREGTSTDVWGTVQRASEIHPHTLVLASDLELNGNQQLTTHHPLTGMRIRVIDWTCGTARFCNRLRSYWNQAFWRSGTTNVQYFLPGQPVGNLFGP